LTHTGYLRLRRIPDREGQQNDTEPENHRVHDNRALRFTSVLSRAPDLSAAQLIRNQLIPREASSSEIRYRGVRSACKDHMAWQMVKMGA
jgi:hypothetical protein